MNEYSVNQITMNRPSRLLGLFSSRAILFLSVIAVISVFLPLLLPHHRVWQNAITTYYRPDPPPGFVGYLGRYARFLISPLLLVQFACFHDLASSSKKIFSRIALSIMIVSFAFQTLAVIWQPQLDHFNIHSCDDQCTLYAVYNMVKRLVSSVRLSSITLLTGFAELFLAPLFSDNDTLGRTLRRLFLASGIMNLLSAVHFEISGVFNTGLIMLLSQMFMIVVMIFCVRFFRQEFRLNADRWI